jgi:hypothetical protein
MNIRAGKGLWPVGPVKRPQGENKQKSSAQPGHTLQNIRLGSDEGSDTTGPQSDQQHIAQKTNGRHHKHMLSGEPLTQNESILRTDRND